MRRPTAAGHAPCALLGGGGRMKRFGVVRRQQVSSCEVFTHQIHMCRRQAGLSDALCFERLTISSKDESVTRKRRGTSSKRCARAPARNHATSF